MMKPLEIGTEVAVFGNFDELSKKWSEAEMKIDFGGASETFFNFFRKKWDKDKTAE